MMHWIAKRGELQRGFTLLEVLLVMAVIAIAISLVRLSLFGGGQRYLLETEARQLFGRMQLAQEEAIIFNRPLGLFFFSEGFEPNYYVNYEWLTFEEGKWVSYQGDEFFARHQVPSIVSVVAETEGKKIPIDGTYPEESPISPQLVFTGSGEGSPFLVDLEFLENGHGVYQISRGIQGEISLEMKSQDEK